MIFDGFGPPFGAPTSRKVDQQSISKFDSFLSFRTAAYPRGGGPMVLRLPLGLRRFAHFHKQMHSRLDGVQIWVTCFQRGP